MSLEVNTYSCDYCEASFDCIRLMWTIPVKNLQCNICSKDINMDEVQHGETDQRGIVCVKCDKLDNLVPKFKLGQNIWYISNNRVCPAPVVTKATIANSFDDWAETDDQKESWGRFGHSGIFYVTCHGLFEDKMVFGTKEQLLASL